MVRKASMKKKPAILIFLIILPQILARIYHYNFQSAGNWLEDYEGVFQVGFIIISLLGSFWLTKISNREKNKAWLFSSSILTLALAVYLYMYYSLSHLSFP